MMAAPIAPATDAPRFAIEALTIPIAADVFADWIAQAGAHQRIPYAVGPSPLRDHPTFVQARAMEKAGLVDLFQSRRGDGRGFDYLAIRRADPQPRAPAPIAAGAEDALTEKVYGRLKNLAALGHPCDTNVALARLCDLPDADAASYRIRKLRDAGRIVVENRGPLERRIVTIVATGKSTAPKREAR